MGNPILRVQGRLRPQELALDTLASSTAPYSFTYVIVDCSIIFWSRIYMDSLESHQIICCTIHTRRYSRASKEILPARQHSHFQIIARFLTTKSQETCPLLLIGKDGIFMMNQEDMDPYQSCTGSLVYVSTVLLFSMPTSTSLTRCLQDKLLFTYDPKVLQHVHKDQQAFGEPDWFFV